MALSALNSATRSATQINEAMRQMGLQRLSSQRNTNVAEGTQNATTQSTDASVVKGLTTQAPSGGFVVMTLDERARQARRVIPDDMTATSTYKAPPGGQISRNSVESSQAGGTIAAADATSATQDSAAQGQANTAATTSLASSQALATYAKVGGLAQVGMSVLSQANQASAPALKLFQ